MDNPLEHVFAPRVIRALVAELTSIPFLANPKPDCLFTFLQVGEINQNVAVTCHNVERLEKLLHVGRFRLDWGHRQ